MVSGQWHAWFGGSRLVFMNKKIARPMYVS